MYGNCKYLITGPADQVAEFAEIHDAYLREKGYEGVKYDEETGAPVFRSMDYFGEECEVMYIEDQDTGAPIARLEPSLAFAVTVGQLRNSLRERTTTPRVGGKKTDENSDNQEEPVVSNTTPPAELEKAGAGTGSAKPTGTGTARPGVRKLGKK
jgi:hypothetical protein